MRTVEQLFVTGLPFRLYFLSIQVNVGRSRCFHESDFYGAFFFLSLALVVRALGLPSLLP